ncbi:MAG: vWA domain-containing protein [Nannocystaceae bacterium]
MRKQLVTLFIPFFFIGACSGNSGDTETTESTSTNPSLSPTDPSTSDSDPTETSGDPSEGPTTETETDSDSEGPCMIDEDCGEGFRCQEDGTCILSCGETVVEDVPFVPPNVILVLDKSGSMVNPDLFWDDDNDDADDDGFQDDNPGMMATPKVSRWRSLHEVVALIGNGFDDKISLGATLFPSVDAQAVLGPAACLVNPMPEVAVSSTNAANVLAGIPTAGDQSLEGGTPAEKGVATSYAHLKSLGAPGDQIAILVTDGAANCSTSAPNDMALLAYDENLVPTVAAAFSDDAIDTYVVGIDISSEPDNQGIVTADVLNDVAEAGGVPREGLEKFYNATNKAELTQALEDILDEVLDCTLTFPDGFPEDTEPTIEGFPKLPDDADCDMETGWKLDESGDFPIIDLCGALCTSFQETGTVELAFICIPPG